MRWPIYLAIYVLSVPCINSIVIKRDFFQPIALIEPSEAINLDSNFLISWASNELNSNLDSQTGVTLNTDIDIPRGNCLFSNPESTDQVQKRQLSSSESGCSDNNQNEASSPSAPDLITLTGGPLQKESGLNGEGGGVTIPSGGQRIQLPAGGGVGVPGGFNGQTEGPGVSPNSGFPGPANSIVPLTRPGNYPKYPPTPKKGSPPRDEKFKDRCPIDFFDPRLTPVCDSNNDEDFKPPDDNDELKDWSLRNV
ncbi:hypothetical protein MMC07_001646 [Pseudocyphellaria aurata]|nr:hypothetical protein [Pseudocyphellaria aurata]